jgi:hypothetical protein
MRKVQLATVGWEQPGDVDEEQKKLKQLLVRIPLVLSSPVEACLAYTLDYTLDRNFDRLY